MVKRKALYTLLLLFMMTIASGSLFATEAQNTGAGISVAIVYSTGGLGDQSFNDAAFAGKERAEAKYPDLVVEQVEPETVTEINQFIESFANNGTFDLIIAIGFSAADGVNASAVAHPNQKFMIVDSVVDQPNVASITFKEHEGSFLVGAMAAMTTQTGKLGFLGGLDIPLINKFRYGYEQGAKYIDPSVSVSVAYSPNPENPWGDLAGGESVAEGFLDQGIDIIYAAAGGTGLGVFEAVAKKEKGEAYAIGVDSNQDHLKPGYILSSMIKKVDVAVETQIDAIVAGTWTAGAQELGLKEDGVDISPMNHTQAERDTLYANGKTRFEIVQDIKQAIINGTITVSLDSVPTDMKQYPINTLHFTRKGTEDAVPLPIAPLIVALMVATVLIRKKKT